MPPKISVVIGKNFGDEGKGRVTHMLSSRPGKSLVVRHNGGAQSGHTVIPSADGFENEKLPDTSLGEKKFIFHEIGSGSFIGADTLWTDTFFPDLFKLRDEYESFSCLSKITPKIYALPDTNATLVCDVLFNMALESLRGKDRHGSCGMGIYEAHLRAEKGFCVTVSFVKEHSEDELYEKLLHIRNYYYRPRIGEVFGSAGNSPYLNDILDNVVLKNTAAQMKKNAEHVEIVTGEAGAFIEKYDNVIFESGQGLLLDAENKRFYPHVTGSRTGLTNLAIFLERCGLKIDEAVYVTRSYVTRHGAGDLPLECERESLGDVAPDTTNVTNTWQGAIRYAPHVSPYEFIDPVIEDLQNLSYRPKVICAVTHLSETAGKVLFGDRAVRMTVEDLHNIKEVSMVFDEFWELS